MAQRSGPGTAIRRIALAAALLLARGAHAAPLDPYVGATVQASSNSYSLLCSTCSIDFVSLLDQTDGGPGSDFALIDTAAPGWAVVGLAALDGPDGLPRLGAYTFADVLHEDLGRTFFYEADVFAQALQRYDYAGSVPETYTIDFTLEGTFTLGANDAASLMSAMGGLTVYGSDYNPFGEWRGTQLATRFVQDRATLGGTHPFSQSGSVTFTVNPGDAFYIWSALSVTADSSHQIIGSTDALHTLALSFSAGDTSLLTPSFVVPEPDDAALAMEALVLAGALRLRRTRCPRRSASRPRA